MAIVWRDTGYNTFRASIGRGLDIAVAYEGITRVPDGEPTWNVFVFGKRLDAREDSKKAAQTQAERTAKKWLTTALAKFESETTA